MIIVKLSLLNLNIKSLDAYEINILIKTKKEFNKILSC